MVQKLECGHGRCFRMLQVGKENIADMIVRVFWSMPKPSKKLCFQQSLSRGLFSCLLCIDKSYITLTWTIRKNILSNILDCQIQPLWFQILRCCCISGESDFFWFHQWKSRLYMPQRNKQINKWKSTPFYIVLKQLSEFSIKYLLVCNWFACSASFVTINTESVVGPLRVRRHCFPAITFKYIQDCYFKWCLMLLGLVVFLISTRFDQSVTASTTPYKKVLQWHFLMQSY